MVNKTFEYHVYLLDEDYLLRHKGEPLIGTDNLAIACSYCYRDYQQFKRPICVYQPRIEGYREHYAPWLNTEEPEHPDTDEPTQEQQDVARVTKWLYNHYQQLQQRGK